MSLVGSSEPDVAAQVVESSPEDLASQRYLLDLALQPLDEFSGFIKLEQIGGSALRYQLNYICYALAMAQYTRTPAFGGYLAEAQANTITKMCDKRVWGYWATERAAGYLRWNPDPIVFGNVMYTGFFAAMLSFYETLNDDRRFDEDGSLPLVWSKRRRFDYGFGSVAAAVERNMRASKHTMYPCEPHLIYPMCNAVALNGLRGYDRLHGTDLTADLVELTRDSMTRHGYLKPNGRFLFGRGPAGLKLPPMLANDAVMAYWLDGIMPDLAQQTWQTIRAHRFTLVGGKAHLRTRKIDHLDVGSYRKGDAWTWANLGAAAREMGDLEAADAVETAIAERYEMEYSGPGARKLAGVSVWANCAYALGRFTLPGSLRGLSNGQVPHAWRTGPMLAAAAYPDVLVAKAVTDGRGLELVLRPGAGAVTTRLQLARLVPGRTYRLEGASADTVTAAADGTAIIETDLADRLELRLTPA